MSGDELQASQEPEVVGGEEAVRLRSQLQECVSAEQSSPAQQPKPRPLPTPTGCSNRVRVIPGLTLVTRDWTSDCVMGGRERGRERWRERGRVRVGPWSVVYVVHSLKGRGVVGGDCGGVWVGRGEGEGVGEDSSWCWVPCLSV